MPRTSQGTVQPVGSKGFRVRLSIRGRDHYGPLRADSAEAGQDLVLVQAVQGPCYYRPCYYSRSDEQISMLERLKADAAGELSGMRQGGRKRRKEELEELEDAKDVKKSSTGERAPLIG